jgi:hypothetical protein
LVGSSLVASAFDFYENMRSDIPRTAIQQLVFCVVSFFNIRLTFCVLQPQPVGNQN